MSDELERLRADLEVLERYAKSQPAMKYECNNVRSKIARLEAEQADSWRKHKELMGIWRNRTSGGGMSVEKMAVELADHLTAERDRLAKENSESRFALRCLLSVMGPPYTTEAAEIAVKNAERVLGIEGEPVDVSMEKPNDDPYSELREALNDWNGALDNGKTIGKKACNAAAQLEALIEANERLAARVAELEAEIKAEDDADIADAEKALAEMVQMNQCMGLYETAGNPMVKTDDPILDPARVLATAGEVLKDYHVSNFLKVKSNFTKPYRLEGGKNGN